MPARIKQKHAMHRIPSAHFMHASLILPTLTARDCYSPRPLIFLQINHLRMSQHHRLSHHAAKKGRKNIFIFISCAALIVKSKADADAAAKLMYYGRNTYIGRRRRSSVAHTIQQSRTSDCSRIDARLGLSSNNTRQQTQGCNV